MNGRTTVEQAGFSVLSVIILLALIAFVGAAALKVVSILFAAIGFLIVAVAAVLLSALPDIKRYTRMSGM